MKCWSGVNIGNFNTKSKSTNIKSLITTPIIKSYAWMQFDRF